MSNPDNIDKVLGKLQKILNIGDSDKNNSVEEVNSAMLLANKLLKKHGLSMADVMTKEEASDSGNYRIRESSASKFKCSKIPGWMTLLVEATNALTDTRCLYISKKLKGSTYGEIDIIFIGIETDTQVAIELFNYLRKTVNKLSSKHTRLNKGNHTVWRSFATGCSVAISERVAHLESFKDDPDIVSLHDESDDEDEIVDNNDNLDMGEFSEETHIKYELVVAGKSQAIDEYLESSSSTDTVEVDLGKTIVKSAYENGILEGQNISLTTKNLLK